MGSSHEVQSVTALCKKLRLFMRPASPAKDGFLSVDKLDETIPLPHAVRTTAMQCPHLPERPKPRCPEVVLASASAGHPCMVYDIQGVCRNQLHITGCPNLLPGGQQPVARFSCKRRAPTDCESWARILTALHEDAKRTMGLAVLPGVER